MRSLQEVLTEFPRTAERGLTAEEVRRSRERFGRNQLQPIAREPLWKKFLEKFNDPIIKILLAAALLSMYVDLFKPPLESMRVAAGLCMGLLAGLCLAAAYLTGRSNWMPALLFLAALVTWPVGLALGHASFDGLAVMVAVVLATGVAFLSEYKSDREFEVLNAQKDALRVKVIRDGEFATISLEEIVRGDLVVLEMGDEIPADGRVIKSTELYVDQSLMTGESEVVHKRALPPDDADHGPDQAGCLYRGTQVADGLGEIVICEVGDATALGQIARRLSSARHDEEVEPTTGDDAQDRVKRKLTISKELTPLQLKLEHLAGVISKVGYVAAVAIFLAQLIQGAVRGDLRWPGPDEQLFAVLLADAGVLLEYFMYMVIIIVVAVPEGLPMSVTVSLAMAMRKMTRANSLVRQLVACETIGSATVICSDKTGTLTQNRMQVSRLGTAGEVVERSSPAWPKLDGKSSWPRRDTPLDLLCLNAAVNSTANLEKKQGKLIPIGNSTEAALLQWLHESHIEYQILRLQFPPVYQVHFSSERKRMTTLIRYDGRILGLVKGAPEWMLDKSQSWLARDGVRHSWNVEAKSRAVTQLAEAAGQAMRTLAFGYVHVPEELGHDEDSLHTHRDELERGLVYLGFVAIHDPLREDVREAVASCRSAGLEVKMITGDSPETARAIGAQIGLLDFADAQVMTSAELNQLSDAELKKRLPGLRILSRARPLDKYRMVNALQELGEVVAVTGDGTNDAPALKKADVGLAMGQAGTEVAKEASKIVLLDDAFSTIVKAVHWGRALYENIQRFIQFQLTINVSALVIALLGVLFGFKPPFTILQLLWINVIMDTFASIALCSEPPRPGLMMLPPKRRDERIVTRGMMTSLLLTAAFFVVVMMGLLLLMRGSPGSPGWQAGTGPWSEVFPDFSVRQSTIFFTVYVLFQVWNQINCRSLTPETSGLRGLFKNPVFLGISGLIVLGQFLIVTLGGRVFQVEPLGLLDWLAIVAATASVLVVGGVIRRLRRATERTSDHSAVDQT